GIMVPKTLADRTHLCPNCGLEMDRDINASLNIRTLGLRGRAYQDPTPALCKSSKQVRSMT
ncbi:MAG: transposase, partial [Methanothrix sp.]|nr:transposase [Methanothrix sp.]